MRQGIVWTLALVLISGVSLGACSEHQSISLEKPLPTAVVSVTEVEPSADAAFFHAVGRVKNVRESTISAKVMGKVTQIRVKAGDKVKAGEVLARIDDRDSRGRVEQARGALAQAKAAKKIARQMLDRIEKLKEQDSTSQAKYDKAQFDYQSAVGAVSQAQGALQTAESYLRETVIKAPFSGAIVDTMIEVGEMASPGYPILRMEGAPDLEFEATVNGQDIESLSVGQKVVVDLDVARDEKKEIAGEIREIVPSQDQITHSSLVRIHLNTKEKLRSGMFGRAQFQRSVGSCLGLLIPENRVLRNGQLSAVFVLDDNHIRLRLIKEGRKQADRVEVLAGLKAGDRLVASELDDLIDGQPATTVQ